MASGKAKRHNCANLPVNRRLEAKRFMAVSIRVRKAIRYLIVPLLGPYPPIEARGPMSA
jgi:hypothetical protein